MTDSRALREVNTPVSSSTGRTIFPAIPSPEVPHITGGFWYSTERPVVAGTHVQARPIGLDQMRIHLRRHLRLVQKYFLSAARRPHPVDSVPVDSGLPIPSHWRHRERMSREPKYSRGFLGRRLVPVLLRGLLTSIPSVGVKQTYV